MDASHSIKFCFLITYFPFAFLHAWQPFYSFLESLISILLPSGKHCILSVKEDDTEPKLYCVRVGLQGGIAVDTPPSYEKVWGKTVLFWI